MAALITEAESLSINFFMSDQDLGGGKEQGTSDKEWAMTVQSGDQ